MQGRLFSIYEAMVLQRPKLALLLSLLIIAWLSSHIPSFKLDASADSLVLEGDQSLKYYREISKRYGSEDFLLVTYSPQQDLLSELSLHTILSLRDELTALEGVSSVVSLLDVPLLNSPPVTVDEIAGGEMRTLLTPGIDKELVRIELTSSPLYKDLLVSGDGKTTAIQVNLHRDKQLFELLERRESLREKKSASLLDAAQLAVLADLEKEYRKYSMAHSEKQNQLVERVREIITPYKKDAQVFLGGVPMITADMVSFVKSDLAIFGSGIILFIIVTLSIIFRRLLWVILPLTTCVLSVAFMMGLITWLDWRMTVISSNFVALLLIITLSITIHLVVRYRELLSTEPELNQRELVKKTTYYMIKPCIYTALTTMVAFASLVVSGIRPVIDFGWMMTIGVTAALVIVFIVLPATLLLLKKPAIVVAGSSSVAITLRFAAFTEQYGKLILTVAFLLTALSLFGVSRLEVENRFIDYFSESTEIYQGMEVIDEQLGGTIPLEIILDAELPQISAGSSASDIVSSEETFDDADDDFYDEFEDGFEDDFADEESQPTTFWFNKAGLRKIEAVHDYMDSLEETGKVLSLATSYKLLRQFTTSIDDIQLALIQQKLPKDIAAVLVDPYLNDDIGQARITVRVMETSKSLNRAELLKQVREHLVNELGFKEEQVHLTGMLVLYNNMLQSLYRSQILTLGAVFIAIVIMFLFLFKSLSMALLAIAPNLLAAGIVLGGMGLFGIPLDIMTVTIAAISIGIGVDNTIHYVHRFRMEFPKDRNYLATMYRCHGSIGKAMYYTSITIIIGFSILAFSNFTPSIYFGLLTSMAMFAALIGALLLLPQLLITFKPLGAEQAATPPKASDVEL
jgi:predicted RND superfamily exporter protein